MKIKELLKNIVEELNNNDIDDARLKAKILIENELAVEEIYLTIHENDEISEEICKKCFENVSKLILGMPIQYITNFQYFYGLKFYVDNNVLIPQPDTEILVEQVINIIKSKKNSIKVLDICTGSGAIAISIAKNTNAKVFASDISYKALDISKRNANQNCVKINFIKSDMFENISGKFDIIVSNPPYIKTDEIFNLSNEVKNEPKIALDGGDDGLKFYRILANESRNFLNKNGTLAVEIGYNQRNYVEKILKEHGFENIFSKKDFGNNDRIVVGNLK